MVYKMFFSLFASSVMLFSSAFFVNAKDDMTSNEKPLVLIDDRGTVVTDEDTDVIAEYNYPVYRRINSGSKLRSLGQGSVDLPDIFEFHIINEEQVGRRLYENSGDYRNPNNQSDRLGLCGGRGYNKDAQTGDYKRDSIGSPGNVISFLGINNNASFGATTNYAIYLDTAFINRGTGWLKPQYMLAVDQYIPEECGACNPQTGNIESENGEYVIGRYLYNASMYAKNIADSMLIGDNKWAVADKYYDKELGEGIPVSEDSTESGYYYTRKNFNKVLPVKDRNIRNPNGATYVHDGFWERLAFSWAIHKGDSLYVLKGVGLEPMYKGMDNDPYQVWLTLTKEYGSEGKYVDFSKLISENIVPGSAYREAYYPRGDRSTYPEMRTYYDFKPATALSPGKTIGLHAIIALDDNTHKDWVFSFRYIERYADDFVIESETTERNTVRSLMVAPGYGGWIKFQNGVPVISRADEKDLMGEACVFNVIHKSNSVDNNNVGEATSKVVVTGGNGAITVQNAAGKNVVISSAIGRIIANTTVSSDNASFTAHRGIFFVTVESEKAFKIVVK